MAWMLNGLKNGGFGNLVEDDTVGLLFVQSQYLTQVPGDGFSFTVLIGCEPYFLGFVCLGLQIGNKFCLFFRNFVFRFKCLVVDAQLFLFQITDMSVTRHDLEVLSQEFLDGLRLGRRLDNH